MWLSLVKSDGVRCARSFAVGVPTIATLIEPPRLGSRDPCFAPPQPAAPPDRAQQGDQDETPWPGLGSHSSRPSIALRDRTDFDRNPTAGLSSSRSRRSFSA